MDVIATRRERVVLDLTDNLTPGLAKAAGAALALDKALDGINGDIGRTGRVAATAAPQIDRFGASATRAGNALDSFSGRTGVLLDLVLALGPAAVAAGAVAVPVVTTLASGFGAVGVAAIGTAVAFGGVGEALETMNKAHLEPTKENLKEAEDALRRLAPAAQDFVRQLDSMRELGMQIRDAGQQGLFPGLTDALVALERRGPDAVRIIEKINREVGDLARDGAESLAGPRWDDFFRMIERQAPRALDTMGRALGDVLHGVSEVMEAFAPTSQSGLSWIGDVADDFDKWATGLKGSKDFREFIRYVRQNGPELAETMGAVATAVVDIGQAAAPLSGPVLNAIEGIAKAVSTIAGSGFGDELMTAAIAMRMMSRVGPGVALATGALAPMATGRPGATRAGRPGATTGATRPSRTFTGGTLNSLPFAPLISSAMADTVEWLGVGERVGGDPNQLYFPALDRAGDFLGSKSGGPGGILGSKSVVEIQFEADQASQARVRAEIAKITARPYTASVELEDQRARRVAQGVHRMLDDVASQRPTPKIDADPAPATGKTNGVKRLLDEVGNKRPRPRIDAQDGASPVINRVSGLLAGLDGRTANTTITTTYVTRRVNEGTGAGFGASDFGVATGGTILPGGRVRRAAGGATVPNDGRGYRDYYPFMLAPGEEVISNRYGQADRHRSLLKAINANRLADGGTARAIAAGLRGGTSSGGGARGGGGGGDVVAVLAPGTRLVMETDLGPLMARVADRRMNAQGRWEREQGLD